MKNSLMLLFLISILISCTPKENFYIDQPLEDVPIADITPPAFQTKEKSSELRITNIQDMKVFNNELYFVTTDKYAGATLPSIYKYVDDKIPPIKVFETNSQEYRNRLTDLNSLEEYDGDLYSGGPMGIFKLDKQSNKFKEAEFSYGFDYVKKQEVGVTLIRAIQGKLYAILNYRSPEGPYVDLGISLAVLEGNTWKLLSRNYLHGVEDLKEHKGELYAGEYQGGVLKFEKNSATNEKEWVEIPTEEPYDLGRFTLLESYDGKLYACGESFESNNGNTYSLQSFSTEEMKSNWKLELDYKDMCTFIKKANGKLYVGADEWYDPAKDPQNIDLIKPLHVFDGKSWKTISFVNAPGLSKGQAVLGVTAIEYFNNKLFIAVKTNYNYTFEIQPSFYTSDNDGVLSPITWWKK